MADEKSPTVQPETKDDIEFHKSHVNILLIAPHGVETKPYDDENTADLTQKISEILQCHPIINRTYRKPNGPPGESKEEIKKRYNGKPNVKKKVLDLNKVKQAERHPNFIKRIKKAVDSDELTYVFWIHGITDENIENDVSDKPGINPKEIQILVGWGQKTNDDRDTAQEKTIISLIKGLNESGLVTVLANPDKVVDKDAGIYSYCGWDRNRMNQWFLLEEKEKKQYTFDEVQSIQLEFRWTGCRDNEENIESTAKSVANAISALIEQDKPEATPNVDESSSENKIPADAQPEKITDPAEKVGVIDVGDKASKAPEDENAMVEARAEVEVVDEDPLVEKAYQHIKKIIIEKIQETILDVGNYLIQQFYENDYKKVKENPLSKHKSLNQLFDKLQTETSGNVPKKSWLYNSINLAVAEKKYKNKKVSIYGKLGLSHKLVLVGQKNLKEETKIELMEKTVDEKWTVLKLQEEVSKIKNTNKLDLSEKLPIKELRKLKVNKLNSMKKRTIEREKNTQKDLTIYQGNLKKIKIVIKSKSKAKNATGFDEWAKIKTNICIGCSNDCKYCYAKYYAVVRFNRVKEDQWAKEQIIDENVKMNRELEKSIIGFPTSHDITPANIDDYLKVLKKILVAGNKVLIVSKPNFDCIKKICDNFIQYNNKIIFRFTIGAMDKEILRFWDTNAPLYEERKQCLKYAYDNGFQTSVSIEPLLEPSNVIQIATDLVDYVSDYIWVGKMRYTTYYRNKASKEKDSLMTKHVKDIEIWQTDEKVKAIYADFQKEPELLKKIKWKDSYEKVLKLEKPTISVSRRTDIPALYSDWFFNRIKAGSVIYRKNTDKKPKTLSLKPENVMSFVFWTKNPGPMLYRLDELKDYQCYFHFTLTPYGGEFEPALPSKKTLIETFRQLSKKIGKEKVIWRYDPILLNDKIDIEYHKAEFSKLAESLHEYTDTCVISFVGTGYLSPEIKKQLNLKEITDDLMRKIEKEFQRIATEYGIKFQTCAEKIDLNKFDSSCAESIDIGTDNTCTHGCLYCYATKNHQQAPLNYLRHNVNSPLMVGNPEDRDVLFWKIKNNEWTLSQNNVNFQTGCSNDCRYCYGCFMPDANKQRNQTEAKGEVFKWSQINICKNDVKTNYSLKDGRVGFPTLHDITPENLDDYLTVLGKLLRAGNKIMIITKPVLECIKAICEASVFFKDQILFRFTITAKSEEVLQFWERDAPSYDERMEALKFAFNDGFQTSVSMEPMLEYLRAQEMVDDFMPYIRDAIWFGKMNHIPAFKDPDGHLKEELAKVEAGHSDENIKVLYEIYKDNPKIKWKLAYKDVLGIPLPPAPGMDI